MTIRALDADIPDAVVDFLEHRVSGRGLAHWRWKYVEAPVEKPAAFCWQEPDGSVLGFIGLMPTFLHDGRERQRAAWFVDWHVTPGERGVGVGLSLLRKAEAMAGTLLTLQGSESTRKILPRLGWKESATPHTWVRPLGPRFVSAWLAHRVPALPRTLVEGAGAMAGALSRLPGTRRPVGTELVDVDRLAEDYEDVWRARQAEFAPLMTRDASYVNRFAADFPGGGYRLQLVRQGERTVGHLLTRIDAHRRGLQRGRIVDVLWPRAESALLAWLVAASCRQLREAGADFVECVISTRDLAAAARRSGFRKRSAVPIWYHRLPRGASPPERWFISLLDCDRAYR